MEEALKLRTCSAALLRCRWFSQPGHRLKAKPFKPWSRLSRLDKLSFLHAAGLYNSDSTAPTDVLEKVPSEAPLTLSDQHVSLGISLLKWSYEPSGVRFSDPPLLARLKLAETLLSEAQQSGNVSGISASQELQQRLLRVLKKQTEGAQLVLCPIWSGQPEHWTLLSIGSEVRYY